MNSFKLNNFQKFACFALIIIMVVCAVGFASDGWQLDLNQINKPSTDNKDNLPQNKEESTDANKDNDNKQDNIEETPPPPQYFSAATGLQISESESTAIPVGVVVNPSAPLYGVSSSDISIEFPIEDGSSRLLVYSTDDETMWKIGSLLPTRNYISNMSNFFGGMIVSYGKDDVIDYDSWETQNLELDLSKHSDCYYVENSSYVYTTEAMIASAQSKNNGNYSGYSSMPFSFSESEFSLGYNEATALTIPFTQTNESQFYYNELTGKYLYYK